MDYASSIGAAVNQYGWEISINPCIVIYIGNSHSITSLVCHRRQQTARESLSELVPPRHVEDPHNLSEHRVQGISYDVSGHHADPKHWLWREEIPPVLSNVLKRPSPVFARDWQRQPRFQ
mmetsp:Transcript_37563/g.56199  ORF Transcript_37563/g.56199 Transcript_37563/m.56199 type:complete len:120 (-) Transcript_37563:413-772(-)